MKLSIIVPVYNMAKDDKLIHCLDSLVGQKLDCEYEIIPVDDASTDNSAEIVADYAARYPKLIKPIYSKENMRQGGAKNLGLEKAIGEWIGFIDSDDWAAPDMFSKMLTRANETGADVVGCQYSMVDHYTFEPGKLALIHTKEQEGEMDDAHKRMMIRRPGSMVVKIYKKSVIDKYNLNFPTHTFYEDNQAGPIWMLHFEKFALVDEPLYFYLQYDNSTVHTINMDRLHNRMDRAVGMLEEAGKIVVDDNCIAESIPETALERYFEDFEASFIRLYYANTLFSYMQSARGTNLKFLLELKRGMEKYTPDFMKNPAFEIEYDEEQKKMMRLHMKNVLLYAIYDRGLRLYRYLRYKKPLRE